MIHIGREMPMWLPVDLREWVAGEDMAHFILEAVNLVALHQFRTNELRRQQRGLRAKLQRAPAAVGAEGSQRTVGARVSQSGVEV